MERDLWEQLSQTPLFLDQTSQPLELDRAEVTAYYEPLARTILSSRQPAGRTIVVVAGPPGSGKSAFGTALTAAVNALAGKDLAVLVGLDGWHYPNAYLDSHMLERSGETLPLRQIKGAPETYDQAGIAAFLASARAASRLTYPVYSREIHDPIADAGAIEPWQSAVILEGNYWLLDEPPWNTYQSWYDLRIFLAAEPDSLIAGLRDRHLRGKKDPAFVEKHMRRVDLPNIERVLRSPLPADVIVHKADSRRIERIEWQN